jgi:hypothetical protein
MPNTTRPTAANAVVQAGKEAAHIAAIAAMAERVDHQADLLMEAGNGTTELHRAMRYGAMALQAKAENLRSQAECLQRTYALTTPANQARAALDADIEATPRLQAW